MPGRFIVFEGGEGTGKSTQIREIEAHLKGLGRDVLVTWEPGKTAIGQRLREILLDPASGQIDVRAEALMYAAARAEHVAKVIRPALERGAIVLCDRYWDASRAYQGAGRGLGMKAVDEINCWATQGLHPDRVYLFDIDPDAGLKRVRARADGTFDRLEAEPTSFHETIRQAYLFLAKREPARYRILDSRDPIEEIRRRIVSDFETMGL